MITIEQYEEKFIKAIEEKVNQNKANNNMDSEFQPFFTTNEINIV